MRRAVWVILVSALLSGHIQGTDAYAQTTNVGVDAAHTGHSPDLTLTPPLQTAWRVRGEATAMVYAAHRVVVSTGYAMRGLDPRSGRELWRARSSAAGLAAEGSTVFSADDDGFVRARSAVTGALLWQSVATERQVGHPSAPTAADGVVYIGASNSVLALDAATGRRLWQADPSGAETDGTPAVTGQTVLMNGACDNGYALRRSDGRLLWQETGCSGGGGPAVVYMGRLYSVKGELIRDAATGARLGKLANVYAGGALAFAGTTQVLRTWKGGMIGSDLFSGATRWQIRARRSERFISPLIVNHSVYAVETTGRVLAASLENGGVRQTLAPFGRPSNGDQGAIPETASIPGGIVVSAYRQIVALRSVYRPTPASIDTGVADRSIAYGERALIQGVAGTTLRRGQPTSVLAADRFPFGRLREASRGRVQPDGYFGFASRPNRNTQYRVTVGAARSRTLRVYVNPRVRLRLGRRARGAPVTGLVRIDAPRWADLARRRAYAYIARGRRLVRVQRVRLRARRRGSAQGRIDFRPPRGLSRRDLVVVCIPRLARAGLGQPSRIDRRCGKRRITVPSS